MTHMLGLAYTIVQERRNGVSHTVARLPCQRCDNSVDVTHNKKTANPEFFQKKFVELGWNVDVFRRSRTRCPSCQRRRAAARASNTEAPLRLVKPQSLGMSTVPTVQIPGVPMTQSNPTPATATTAPLVQPTADHKRRIRDKLDHVFDDGKGCYLDAYTDKRIGEELRMPAAWVTQVREAAYGPIRSDPELDELRKLAAAFEADVKTLQVQAEQLAGSAARLHLRIGEADKRLRGEV